MSQNDKTSSTAVNTQAPAPAPEKPKVDQASLEASKQQKAEACKPDKIVKK